MYQNGAKTIGDFLSADVGLMLKTDFSKKKINLQGVYTMQCNSIISAITKYLKCSIKRQNHFHKGFIP